VVLVLLGWFGTSHITQVFGQIPYLNRIPAACWIGSCRFGGFCHCKGGEAGLALS
jgi:hypothetical protein